MRKIKSLKPFCMAFEVSCPNLLKPGSMLMMNYMMKQNMLEMRLLPDKYKVFNPLLGIY